VGQEIAPLPGFGVREVDQQLRVKASDVACSGDLVGMLAGTIGEP
jgi:hypothetical protein